MLRLQLDMDLYWTTEVSVHSKTIDFNIFQEMPIFIFRHNANIGVSFYPILIGLTALNVD